MDNRKLHIEVDKTLELLDREPVMEQNPFFYTRVKAIIDAKQKQNRVLQLILRPVLVTAVIINLFVLGFYLKTDENVQPADEEFYSLLAEDYSFSGDYYVDFTADVE